MNGILIINKEENVTSRDVVNMACKKLNTKKIGHTGTLDPMAKGVLVLAVGKALKIVEDITSYNKEYIAEVTLGIETDTLDITGNVLKKEDNFTVNKKEVIKVLNSFLGEYKMEVPKYSAIKVNGKKLYEYARNNEEVKLPIKNVVINSIELLEFKENKFTFKCNVSKGTYIRSLIRDICKKLNTPGCMSDLIRTKQGNFSINDAIFINDINEKTKLIPIRKVLSLPEVEVSKELYPKIKNGNKLKNIYSFNEFSFIYNNEVIAIYISCDKLTVKPKKMFI